MSVQNDLSRFFRQVVQEVAKAEDTKPNTILIDGAQHSVDWRWDDDMDAPFALVWVKLPAEYEDRIFPSVDQDTYGYLEGFRVYYGA